MLTQTKPWYASKGVWGGLIGVASPILAYLGYAIAPEDADALVAGLTTIGGALGGVLAIVGRVGATTQIG